MNTMHNCSQTLASHDDTINKINPGLCLSSTTSCHQMSVANKYMTSKETYDKTMTTVPERKCVAGNLYVTTSEDSLLV